MPVSLSFFTTLDLICGKFYPCDTPTHFVFQFRKEVQIYREITADSEISFEILSHLLWLLTPWFGKFSFK